jgi:ribosome-associated protein
MAKKIVKKAAKKTTKKTTKKTAGKKTAAKKSGKSAVKTGKKAPAKKGTKKPISEKERETRQANLIANSEKKKNKTKGRKPKVDRSSLETSSLLDAIVEGMEEKKAKNIVVVDLRAIENRVSDYFVVCDAESRVQVEAIAGSVEDEVEKRTKERPFHAEGYGNSEWIIVDYVNIVAHIFQTETRNYYNIEGLWADAEFKEVN